MKTETRTCDIEGKKHEGNVREIALDVIFDHDQEDGTTNYYDCDVDHFLKYKGNYPNPEMWD